MDAEVLHSQVLPGGHRFVVRHAGDGDVMAIHDLYGVLRDEDRYRRFFSSFRPSDTFVARWVADCTQRGALLVAEVDGRLVAEAGYVGVPNGDGEFAVTVAPDHRGWLGPFLLDLLVAEAARRGVPNLEADILSENRAMIGLVRHRGAVTTAASDLSVVHVRIGTGPEGPTWPPLDHRPRVVVEARSMTASAASGLRGAGLEVVTCPRAASGCVMDLGRPCPLAGGAAAVLLALPAGSERAAELAEAHRRWHPQVAVLADAGSRAAAASARADVTLPGPLVAALADLAPSFVLVHPARPAA